MAQVRHAAQELSRRYCRFPVNISNSQGSFPLDVQLEDSRCDSLLGLREGGRFSVHPPIGRPILSTETKNRRRVTFIGHILTFCRCPAREKHDSLGHPKIIFSVNLSSLQLTRERVATFTTIQQQLRAGCLLPRSALGAARTA